MTNSKQATAIAVIAGLLGLGISGCGATASYKGGCIVPPTEDQRQSVQAYLDHNKAEATPFITKGKTLTACYANYDPREYDSKKRQWDAARTDLNFPNSWASDVDAAIAGYAVSGMPLGKNGVTDLERVSRVVTLKIRNGRSYFPSKTSGQERRLENLQVELEDTPPANQNFKGGVIAK